MLRNCRMALCASEGMEGVVAARGDGREMKVMEMMKRQTVEETDAD